MPDFNIPIGFIFLLLLNSVVSLLIFTNFLRYKKSQISKSGMFISYIIGLYSFGYAMELIHILNKDKLSAFLWYKIQYFAIPFISIAWYFFTLAFTERKIKKGKVLSLLIIPLIIVFSVWTNDTHRLFLKRYLENGSYLIGGPLYYVSIIYNYFFVLLGCLLMFIYMKRAKHYQNKLSMFHILAAVLIPLVSNIVYLFLKLNIDTTVFGLTASVFILMYESLKKEGIDFKEKVKNIVYKYTSDMILVTDKSGIIIDFNENFYNTFSKLMGITELKYKRIGDILSSNCMNIVNNGSGIVEKFGRWFEIKTNNIQEKNKIIGKIIFFHEITEIKKLQEKQAIENERYRILFEFAPIGIVLEDENGVIIDANPYFVSMQSIPKDELIGKHISFLAPKEDIELVRMNIDKILSGKTLIQTVRSLGKSGETRYSELYETKITLPNGRPGILSIQKDITRQVVAQNIIRKLAKYQQLVLELALNFINLPVEELEKELRKAIEIVAKELNIDRLRVYKFSNDEAYSVADWFYSTSESDLVSTSFNLNEVKGEEYANLFAGKQFVVEKDKTNIEIIKEYLRNYNTSLITPIKLNNNIIGFISAASLEKREWSVPEKRIMLLLATLLTNTEMRKNYEQELIIARKKAEEASIAKSAFLANMSHEIRTPLNGIIGFANLLKETPLNETQQKYVDTILKSSEILIGILNDILDLAKIESGKFQIESTECNLKAELQSSLILYEAKAKEKNVTYTVYIDQNISDMVEVDSLRLQQVLFNLINNAIKFTPSGGKVSVSVEKVSEDELFENVRFTVEDTGIGIPKERLDKIFEPFEQADISITKKYGGTGLGLAISQHIVNLMGSSIIVKSEEGKGSEFSFELRLKKVKSQQEKREAINKAKKYYRAKVLVAEDYDINRLFMSELLKKYGITPDFAINGKEAVDKALSQKYDLIFMDVLMPELDGLEATKKIRAVDLDTPIVALTAHALKNVKDEVLSVGMNDFVTKPVKIEEIELILEKFCGHLSIEINSNEENNNIVEIEKSETTEEKINIIKESIEKTIAEDGLDNEFVKDLLVTFLNSAKNSINNIISALKDGTFDKVQLEAHSIKGAARTLNLDEVANVAYEIEMHAKEKSVDFDYEKHLKILEDWINNFEIYYKKFFE